MLHIMAKLLDPDATPRSKKSPSGQRVGYIRVSTLDQNEQRQLDGVDLDRTFLDKASGKDTKRPQLDAMLAFVREDDRSSVIRWTGWPATSTIFAGSSSVSPAGAFRFSL